MGCGESTEQKDAQDIEKMFKEYQLQECLTGEFAEDQERHIFMAINVLRFAPKTFVEFVKNVKKSYPMANKAKHTDNLLTFLKESEPLPPIRYNEQANLACRRNNEVIYEANEKTPARGGNIIIYSQTAKVPCEEYTMC